jgi:hypothetical protein
MAITVANGTSIVQIKAYHYISPLGEDVRLPGGQNRLLFSYFIRQFHHSGFVGGDVFQV